MNIRNAAFFAGAYAAIVYIANQISVTRRYESFNDNQDSIAPTQPIVAPTQPIVNNLRQLSDTQKAPVWLEKNNLWQLSQDCGAGLSNVVNSLSTLSATAASSRYANYVYNNCDLSQIQAQSVSRLLLNQFQANGVENTIDNYRSKLIDLDFVTAMANASQGQSFADLAQSFRNTFTTTLSLFESINGTYPTTPPADDQAADGGNVTGLEDPAPAAPAPPAPPADDQAADGGNVTGNGSNDTGLEDPAPAAGALAKLITSLYRHFDL